MRYVWIVVEFFDDPYSEYSDIRKNIEKAFLSAHKAEQFAAELQNKADEARLRGYSYEVECCSLDDSVD